MPYPRKLDKRKPGTMNQNAPTNKRPFANVGNIFVKDVANNDHVPVSLKRVLDSPSNSQPRKLSKGDGGKRDENHRQCSDNDPTRTIECKIKTITIGSNAVTKQKIIQDGQKHDDSVLFIKAVKGRAGLKNKEAPTVTGLARFYRPPPSLPPDVPDYDLTQIRNIDAEPIYAFSIFEYLRQKEVETRCTQYMDKQPELTEKVRAILVDWLVEVQQTFELNHESLYHGIKIMDHYLMKVSLPRVRYQLLGMASIFIAAKLDERLFPIMEDFIYISDDAYSREEFIKMEMEVLRVLDFDINYPLSYTFLRRYARCSSQTIETLTLSRYILETSLLDYSFVDELDSKMAAASLLLAMKMKQLSWNKTLEFYSGYKPNDLKDLVIRLNRLLKMAGAKYPTIRSKYSDSVFFAVALTPPLDI